jgi:hypothetical protein
MSNYSGEVLFYFSKSITTDILVTLIANNLTLHKAHYVYDPENLCFTVGFLGDEEKNEVIQVGIIVERSIPFLRFGIFIFSDVPHSRINAVVELITRLNSQVRMGAFKFDYETQNCVFEYNIYPLDQPISDAVLFHQIEMLLKNYYFVLDAFKSVILDDQKPLLVYHTLIKSTNSN